MIQILKSEWGLESFITTSYKLFNYNHFGSLLEFVMQTWFSLNYMMVNQVLELY